MIHETHEKHEEKICVICVICGFFFSSSLGEASIMRSYYEAD